MKHFLGFAVIFCVAIKRLFGVEEIEDKLCNDLWKNVFKAKPTTEHLHRNGAQVLIKAEPTTKTTTTRDQQQKGSIGTTQVLIKAEPTTTTTTRDQQQKGSIGTTQVLIKAEPTTTTTRDQQQKGSIFTTQVLIKAEPTTTTGDQHQQREGQWHWQKHRIATVKLEPKVEDDADQLVVANAAQIGAVQRSGGDAADQQGRNSADQIGKKLEMKNWRSEQRKLSEFRKNEKANRLKIKNMNHFYGQKGKASVKKIGTMSCQSDQVGWKIAQKLGKENNNKNNNNNDDDGEQYRKLSLLKQFDSIKKEYKNNFYIGHQNNVNVENAIARRLGSCRSKIYRWKKEFGQSKKFSHQQKRKIIEQFDALKAAFSRQFNAKTNAKIDDKIARKIGVAAATILRWKRKTFGEIRRPNYTSAEQLAFIRAFDGMKKKNPLISDYNIAKRIGTTPISIKRWKTKFSIEYQNKRKRTVA